jgi:hypothetical protein
MGLPGCVTCHENHEIVKPSEAFFRGTRKQVLELPRAGFRGWKGCRGDAYDSDGARRGNQAARQTLARAAEAGMEVSEGPLRACQADDALTKARASIHRFQVAAVRENSAAGPTVAKSAHQAAKRALAERDYWRRGFSSLSLSSS